MKASVRSTPSPAALEDAGPANYTLLSSGSGSSMSSSRSRSVSREVGTV
jgi:hypothetical protein